jgi:signal transduction histidine kinase
MRTRWVLAGTTALLYVVGSVVDLFVERASGWYAGGLGELLVFVPVVVSSFAVGWLLVLRRAGGAIGWLLLTNWLVLGTFGFASTYAGYAYSPVTRTDLPGARLAAAWDTHGWPLLFAPFVMILLLLPNGTLLSRRWRWVVGLGVVSFAATTLGGLLGGERLDRPFQDLPPYDVLPDPVHEVLGLGLLGMTVTVVLAAASLVLRYRRADGVVRRQLKWIALAGCLLPVAILSSTFLDNTGDSSGAATAVPFVLLFLAIPASIGVAVLRYRLWDVDRVVAATVVYAAVTVLLAAAFGAVIVVGGVLLGGGSPVTTAAATLAVALAFRPVRALVQSRVERSFNPRRWSGEQLVDTFLADLRTGRREPEEVAATLARAVEDPGLDVFYWLPSQESYADADGQPVPDLPATPAGRTPVRRGELRLAAVVHADRRPVRKDLEHFLVRAGLAVEIARLRVEVRSQLAEVERSRARIVTAALDERRRLERDLHDGAQQQLVAIGLDLRHLQGDLDPGSPVERQLDVSVARLTSAIRELRELAHGVRPASLDAGLAPALSELAGRAPVRTVLDVTDERFAADVEAAAYFVVSEALANALKHATPAVIEVLADRVDGRLVVVVTDDGPGGAPATRGSGLTGLSDRLAALGGTLTVDSPPAGGTRVTAELPCA